MSLQRQFIFWFGIFVLLVVGLYALREILLPFIAGMVIAYFLDPLADKLEELGCSRLISTLIITVLFTLACILFLMLVVPVLVQQLTDFGQRLPGLFAKLQQLITVNANDWLIKTLGFDAQSMTLSDFDLSGKLTEWFGSITSTIITGGAALVSIASLFIVTPVVAFYMLNDWDRMIAKIDSLLPRSHLATIRQLATDIDYAMAGFVRGQGTVCLLLGIFYAVGLSLMGLNFGLLIGMISGLISFIPYVGSIVGLALSVGVALVQFFPDWITIAIIIAIFGMGQFLEGNILAPKLVGNKIGLHPVWMMFALFAFAYLFGFVGMLLAIPLAAAVGVLVRFALSKYLESYLYDLPNVDNQE